MATWVSLNHPTIRYNRRESVSSEVILQVSQSFHSTDRQNTDKMQVSGVPSFLTQPMSWSRS